MTRRALAVVVQLARGNCYRNEFREAPILEAWRRATVGRRVKLEGDAYEVVHVLIERASVPLPEPVLVRSISEWEETGRTLPRGEERAAEGGLFDGGFAGEE